MGLKTFHLIFITVSTIFTVWFGVWEIQAYRAEGRALDLFLGVGSLASTVVLLIYGRYFLKKLKTISYL